MVRTLGGVSNFQISILGVWESEEVRKKGRGWGWTSIFNQLALHL